MMYLLYKTITRATIPPFPILPRDVDPSDDVVDNHDISAIIVATVVPTTIISTLFAFARLYVKGWIQRRIQYDDGILLAAAMAGWTATGTTLKAVALGNGKHVGISAATNAYLAIYVALSVRRLKIARRKRLAITISLVLGLLALFTALFKCTRLKSLGSPDFTYDSADLVIWTSLEADVVIIAACIPALQPLVDHLFPGHFSTPMPSPTIPASPTSTASRRKLWPGPTGGDLEAARDFSLSPQGLEMIMIEKEFEIAYSRTTVKRSCTSDTWVSELPDEEKFRIVKDHGPDGSITTTVVVRSATRPPDHPAFPPQ
ncbi:hypothetical protein CMEL01_08598 [Colletotrichum melonis]|uniref:Rhodopsin domain-containing protein n=1 Tax=Colletotrichum melonis TaxID=1209925 RepID=A0AAI9XH35_9PEZI|nr:hypothetical protein CMEL01_08598 [Colletotrichum melonis]